MLFNSFEKFLEIPSVLLEREFRSRERNENVMKLKAMLHEALFLAACNATIRKTRCVESCKKIFTCNTPFCN